MITYVYETIPKKTGQKVRHFEIKQGMNDPALTEHPETGEPIRRVILGGYGFLRKSIGETGPPNCGCGSGGSCG